MRWAYREMQFRQGPRLVRPRQRFTKVAISAASILDGAAFRHIAAREGEVMADEIYSDGRPA